MLKTVLAMLTIATALSLVSCKKENINKFSYKQTGCADVWGYNGTTAESLIKCVTYLSDNGIVVKNYHFIDEKPGSVCLACTCTTGIVYKVFVDEKYADKILALGFVRD